MNDEPPKLYTSSEAIYDYARRTGITHQAARQTIQKLRKKGLITAGIQQSEHLGEKEL